MKPSQQFDEFRLDDSSQSCLAIAYLRLIDLDIIASNSKAQKKKLSDRNAYVKLLGKLAPIDTTESQLSSLNGPLSDNLRTKCKQVSSLEHQAVILSELAFFQPWSGKKWGIPLRIEESIRLIALKEVASFLNVTKPNKIVDHIIDDTSNVRDYEKIIKAGAYAATGAVIGGLMMAPHIGAAIGVGMGLSGAAAMSAGLAAIGFGSIASGGFGMAGGTIILSTLIGTAGLGTGTITVASKTIMSDEMIEAHKLRVTLTILKENSATGKDIAVKVMDKIQSTISQLQATLDAEQAREKPNRKICKDLKNEIKYLKKSLPD